MGTLLSALLEHTWYAKLILELAGLLKHLYSVVVGIRHDDVLLHTQTEAVGRVELAFTWSQLTKLTSESFYQQNEVLIIKL